MRHRWLARRIRASIETVHTYSAAMQTASSRLVQASVIRISSVGSRACGRASHQTLVGSSISPASSRLSIMRWYSPSLSNRSGIPVRGSSCRIVSR